MVEPPPKPQVQEEPPLDIAAEVVGGATELSPSQKARLTMACVILGGAASLLLLSGGAELFCAPERLKDAEALFEFAKTFAPPVVTLVLGYYFRSSELDGT